jgi:hypothetical protein
VRFVLIRHGNERKFGVPSSFMTATTPIEGTNVGIEGTVADLREPVLRIG